MGKGGMMAFVFEDEQQAPKSGRFVFEDEQSTPATEMQEAEPSITDTLKRQAGLTGRILLEGVGDVAGIVGNPLSAMTGARRPSVIASDIASRMGLPTPESGSEKFVNAAGRGIVGVGAMIGGGQALSRSPRAMGEAGKWLSAQPVAQAVSSGLGAGSSELARQSGAGEGGQLVAGLAGSLAPTIVPKALQMAGSGAANLIGGIGTHTGGESIKQAASAGMRGGKVAEIFKSNMRGNTQIEDVLSDVKANIDEMGRQKSLSYKQNMAGVKADKTVLSFDGIDNAMKNAYDMATFKGQVKNVKAAKSLQDVYDAIGQWKNLNPAEYHTPEGMDALKQNIGGILESIPFEEKTARSAVGSIYNSIKGEINRQAPVYSKTMADYSNATERIREIEKTLSAGDRASIDSGIRKLQSLMRNNAATNYGNRIALAKELEQTGGKEFMPALAGQALNTWTPRGLGGAVAGGIGLGAGAMGGLPAAVPALAVQSPRLMGEAAYYTGKLAGLAKPLSPTMYENMTDASLRSLLYGGMGANK